MYNLLILDLFIFFLLELILFNNSMKVSIFHFRCVAFAGMMCITLMFLFEMIHYGIAYGTAEFNLPLLWEAMKQFPADFAHLVIVLISILGVLMFISNIELMKKEGIGLGNLVGTFLGLIYVIPTQLMYSINGYLQYLSGIVESVFFKKLFTMLPTFFYCLIDYAECLIIGIMVMGYIAATQKPKYDVDYIIIPGCAISKTGRLLPLLKGRVLGAVKYAWEQEIATGRPSKYVPSGGQGDDEIMPEGKAMELFLLSHGAEKEEILSENRSTSTVENIGFSWNLIKKEKKDAKVAIATTNYHVLRCGMVAHKMGLEAEGIGSKTKWYFWPNGFAREVVAIFSMTRNKHLFFAIVSLIFSILCII